MSFINTISDATDTAKAPNRKTGFSFSLTRLSLYQRLAISVSAAFIVIAYLLLLWSTSLADHAKHQAEQKLHLQLAKHLASDNPLLQDGVYDKAALENLFHTLMLLGPAFEFYFVDPAGNILTYSADDKKIKRNTIDLAPLVALIASPKSLPIYGDDPRHNSRKKIFSVAPIYTHNITTGKQTNSQVIANDNLQGYLYVIIGGEIYDSIFSRVKTDQQLQQNGVFLFAALLLLLLLLLVIFRFFTHPIRQLVNEMEAVKAKNFNREQVTLTHWQHSDSNEVHLLGQTFNEMVEQINNQLQQLTNNEQIRKELLAHLSHDLRTPLAAMQGYIETIAIKGDTLESTDRQQYINIVLRNAKQLKLLIDQIFELAHLEDGQVSVTLETFPIGELIIDIVAKFALKAKDKNIKLSVHPKQCMFLVYSDIAKLERILSNLIDNALRHTPKDGAITIDVEQQGEKIKVSVIDTGSGISKKDIAYIFDARYRASNATGDQKRHVGLGLAISKKLSLLLNSELNVVSELGKGSQFSFSLQTVLVK
jgi:signal transduction histidine kinase